MSPFEILIAESFGIDVFSYNSDVTDEFWNVLKEIKEHRPANNRDIAKKIGLKESHVELIQYLICNNNHAEYGISPRGCWLTEKGDELYRRLLFASRKDEE